MTEYIVCPIDPLWADPRESARVYAKQAIDFFNQTSDRPYAVVDSLPSDIHGNLYLAVLPGFSVPTVYPEMEVIDQVELERRLMPPPVLTEEEALQAKLAELEDRLNRAQIPKSKGL